MTLSCGRSADKEAEETREEAAGQMEDAAAQMQEAAQKMEEAAQKMAKGENVAVVDFRQLKELLPEKIAGMDRKTSEGEKTGGFGFTFSTARATYEEDNKRLEVNIADTGGVGMAIMGMAAWSQMEMDRETEEGYERTTMIEGYKAFEKYNSRDQRGEISLIVGSRFIVNIEGRNISEKDLQAAVKGIDLAKLEKL